MTRLRETENQPYNDWVNLKEVAPFKIEENKWMLWASWGFIFLLPMVAIILLSIKIF